MDLSNILEQLYAEKTRIEYEIAALERLASFRSGAQPPLNGDPLRPHRRRGRSSMGDAERRQVAERMKRYWAVRRSQQAEKQLAASNGKAGAEAASDSGQCAADD